MSFGDGSHGALGLPLAHLSGPGSDSYEPTRVPGLPSDIANVSAGHYHSLALTSQGQVWSWGRNKEFQLGHGLSHVNRLTFLSTLYPRSYHQVNRRECVRKLFDCSDPLN